MLLFPQPQSLTLLNGSIPTPPPELSLDASLEGLLPSLEAIGFARVDHAPIHLSLSPSSPNSGYTLSVSSNGVFVKAADLPSAFHGLVTLKQLLEQRPATLPHLDIRDWPEVPVRGYMLDISRCRVPTQASLYQLVDLLASLKYNQLQLHTEHTFAYRDHEPVWRNASPLSPNEIRALDDYCHARFIELVPNQNSFGHMERWLRHPAYHHLAESPHGFEHPLSGWKDHGSTLRPSEASASFVANLYDELLPNFRSRKLNIGGDEPWELGQGFSKPLVETRGKHRVYLDHLIRIQKKVQERNRSMQFWGDILIEEPDLARELSEDVTALLWGYEAEHPFASQCAAMSQVGKEFYVVPGTSTWNSLGGRLHTALPNILAAVENAVQHQAKGILLTDWGDNGHHQPPLISLIPILLAAGLSWKPSSGPLSDLAAAAKNLPSPVSNFEYAAIEQLGNIANLFATPLHNASWLNKILFTKPSSYRDLEGHFSMKELETAEESLGSIPTIAHLEPARELLLFAAEKGKAILAQRKPPTLPSTLIERYRSAWLETSRPGGLPESIAHLSDANP